MERICKYITEKLRNKGLKRSFLKEIEDASEKNIITPSMPLSAAYVAFIVKYSPKFPILNAVMKNTYLYDISFELDGDGDKIEKELKNALKERIEYVNVENTDSGSLFVGIKLSKDAFKEIKNVNIPAYQTPYYLIKSCESCKAADFKEKLFNFKGVPGISKKFAELVEDLKSCDLPLSIVDYDILNENTSILPIVDAYIYLEESSSWPEDEDALNCAKTAFYCQLYTKSKYSTFLDKRYVVFKHKNVSFRVKILIKRDFNVKYKIRMELMSILKRQDALFHRKCQIAKGILCSLGFYPLMIDDFLVDLVCLMIGKDTVGDGKFIEDFLSFNFDLDNKKYILDSFKLESLENASASSGLRKLKVCYNELIYNFILPSSEIIENLKEAFKSIKNSKTELFDDSFKLRTNELLTANFEEWDVILSKDQKEGFTKIENSRDSEFLLGVPSYEDFMDKFGSSKIKFYYSPLNGLLMIKSTESEGFDLLINCLIAQTAFNYIKFK